MASNRALVQATARASASVPARRGPISVVRAETKSQAGLPASACSRRRSAVAMAAGSRPASAAWTAGGKERARAQASRQLRARIHSCPGKKRRPGGGAWVFGRSTRLERVADLGEQLDLFARPRRRRLGLRLLALHRVDRLDEQEDGEGDDEEVHHGLEEGAVIERQRRQLGAGGIHAGGP